MISSPVLLLVYRRPEVTQRVLESLRSLGVGRLYVVGDGPRVSGGKKEAEAVAAVRELVDRGDWGEQSRQCLWRQGNLGCAEGVSSGISWFFEQEERGIILEDDCLVGRDWFGMADFLLDHFRTEKRVGHISAQNPHPEGFSGEASYLFSRYPHCWGWGTWRNRWARYDHAMSDWPELRESDWLRNLLGGNRVHAAHWRSVFDRVSRGEIDSWAYRWTYTLWRENWLSVLPGSNQVEHLDFSSGSTHFSKSRPKIILPPVGRLERPFRHPESLQADMQIDALTERRVYRHSLIKQIGDRLARYPGFYQLREFFRAARARFQRG